MKDLYFTILSSPLVWVGVLLVVVLSLLNTVSQQSPSPRKAPLEALCTKMGLGKEFTPLLLVAALVALALIVAAVLTLFQFMKATLQLPPYDSDKEAASVSNIGLVLAALLGAPFVVWRSWIAAKQANIAEESLFNDKINAASEDLASRRQVTRVVQSDDGSEAVLTEWEDDLVKRAASIDRLEGLAEERPDSTARIARMLSVYVRELSK
ncbi:hypothetical protein [Pseudoruegeria sp. HB172150]|uniref:hypothetical protein n=1 Tax=Pseudoruegeria sp. HB172150 TaxID=2721164 RepID=UPI0015578C1C|nr:hypothetical protein [Pseudoruegeria sp. HB172150]